MYVFSFFPFIKCNFLGINYQNCLLKYRVNKFVPLWLMHSCVARHSISTIIIPYCAISFIQRSVPSASTTGRKSCPTMTNYFLVMSVDEIFSRVLLDGKGKTTTHFARCNLSLSLCNNSPRSLERGVASLSVFAE